MNVTTGTIATLMLVSCLTPVMNAAPQRGRNRPPAEAWLIEKPIGGQSAYAAPMRPVWKLADLKKMHAGKNNWSEPVVLDDEQDATYNSGAPGTKITTRMHPQSATVFMVMAGQVRFTVEGQEPVVTKRGSIVNILKNTLYSYEVVGTENALWIQDSVRGYGTVFPIDGPSPTPGKGKEVVKVEFSHKPGAYTKPSHLHVNTFDAIATCTVGPAVAEERMYVVPHVNYVNPADDKCRAAAGGGGRGGDDGEGPAGAAGAAFNAKEPFGHLHSGAVEWWVVQAGGISGKFENLGEFHAVEGDVIYAPPGTWHQMTPEAPSGPSIRVTMGAYQRIGLQNTGPKTP
jgi:mannose-6-phosphate isomerase-like protein (cupin superfamily)